MKNEVLTDGELAEMLKVSSSTIRRMWWRGELPKPIKVGFVNRWRAADIQNWLAEQPTSTLYDDKTVERKLA
jgi:predicted DNA-binding transcriptional regulator AlpA